MNRQPLVVGNWKMHGTVGETLKRITAIHRKLEEAVPVDIVVAPPFTTLYSASVALQEIPIKLCAQDVHWETEGAFTGEVSGTFLKDAGCDYVIIGHSERRQVFREDDEMINRKLIAALSAELTAIFCIGETEAEREQGKTFQRLEEQLDTGLKDLQIHDLEGFGIAYEPVWAIGTGKTATTEQVVEVHDWIRNHLAKKFDAPTANGMRLLYGGSVKASNAKELMQVSNVDGLLVGGASLDPEEFVGIIRAVA